MNRAARTQASCRREPVPDFTWQSVLPVCRFRHERALTAGLVARFGLQIALAGVRRF